MKSQDVDLADNVSFKLFFLSWYENGNGAVDYLHQVRTLQAFQGTNPREREEKYWANLENYRMRFADEIEGEFDLIVDAPSNSGYHRPYLSAVRRRFPETRCVHILKETHVNSTKEHFEDIRNGCRFLEGHEKDIAKHHQVLIVDDVYSKGGIVRTVIEILKEAGLPTDAAITVACPLRIHHDEATEAYTEFMEASKQHESKEE